MTAVGRFSTRPLYLQVKDMLIQRIAAGAWKPGAAIPNEIELSRELGISVGTVRKALDEMESERLISRRQGRGTFVIDQTSNEYAVRFSNIRDPDGIRIAGDTESCTVVAAAANETEARRLQLRSGEPIFRIHRVRTHNDVPLMVEESTVPQARFPGLAQEGDVSPSIVVLAHHYGVLLGRAEERIGVAAAKGEVAKSLKVAEGTPC
ncbi:MAG: GntR family transcriptional regulator [Hyphomicrobium sp.]|nr:GntR family transcriptional regulator [Hyphomicrobium sp.]